MTQRALMTVAGPIDPSTAGIADAHNHVWITPVEGAQPGVPVLFDQSAIARELADYKEAGGGTQIDCQPGGCGRDGRVLAELSRSSGVHIVACTGFHLEKYYPLDYWLWRANVDAAQAFFLSELSQGLIESPGVCAGFIKIACKATLGETSPTLLEATAWASRETDAAIEIHTEQGASAEDIVSLFVKFGVSADRLVICHVDKRPDIGLHRSLAQAGVMLEYDTFYRTKYQPEQNVWRLLEQMITEGLDQQIAIGTDMADAKIWARLGKGPGLMGLAMQIIPRLQAMGYAPKTIQRLVGQNIVNRLTR